MEPNTFVHFEGTGTLEYNWLKVIWYDGSWLGESPADIQKFVNCPCNFILNKEILCRLVRKAFENRRDRLWPAFKIDELALAGFKNWRVGSGQL
jgi:hypothetical protein